MDKPIILSRVDITGYTSLAETFGIRCFSVEFDLSKLKPPRPDNQEKQSTLGAAFPNGLVVLDNGLSFQGVETMKEELHKNGKYTIEGLE